MTKDDDEDFENSTQCWICDHIYIDSDVKVRDHCHITGKYRGFAHRDCKIKVKLNDKIPIVVHNLNNYDSHLFMQEFGKFNLKINFITNGLKKCISFNFNIMLILINSFQFLRSSLELFVKMSS